MTEWEERALFAYTSFLKLGRGVIVIGEKMTYVRAEDVDVPDRYRPQIEAMICGYDPKREILVFENSCFTPWRAQSLHTPANIHHNFVRTGWLPSKGSNPGEARRAFSPRRKR